MPRIWSRFLARLHYPGTQKHAAICGMVAFAEAPWSSQCKREWTLVFAQLHGQRALAATLPNTKGPDSFPNLRAKATKAMNSGVPCWWNAAAIWNGWSKALESELPGAFTGASP